MIPHHDTHNYGLFADQYAILGLNQTYFLAFRDIPALTAQFVLGGKAVDHCCGAGRSARLLQHLGFQVTGVDRSEEMLVEARKLDPSGNYRHAPANTLEGIPNHSADFVFQSIALMEYSSKDAMEESFQEYARVLRRDGKVIVITTSEDGYVNNWTSFENNHPENVNLRSGDLAKVIVRGTGIVFWDYYWTDRDYREVFQKCGFEVLEMARPLARGNEPFEWVNELTMSNWSIYVLARPS